MKSKKPTKNDQLWGKAIEKRVEAAKLNLDHPDGQKRFKNVMRNALKKKSK